MIWLGLNPTLLYRHSTSRHGIGTHGKVPVSKSRAEADWSYRRDTILSGNLVRLVSKRYLIHDETNEVFLGKDRRYVPRQAIETSDK